MTVLRQMRVAGTIALLVLLARAGDQAVQFVDVAAKAGLNDVFYCGSTEFSRYIIETLGGGVALLDYDRDGLLDVFFVTGSRLDGFPKGQEPTNHLYRNAGDGTFRKVTAETGLATPGWGQGVCAGDYDNDGFEDLFVTYYGENRLYRNNSGSGFRDVSAEAGVKEAKQWSTSCAFVDYDLDGRLDLFIANYIVFEKEKIPLPGEAPTCRWKGLPVMCGPKGLPGGTNVLFHNEGGGKFRNVSGPSGVAKVNDRYSLSVTTLDYNQDGYPDIYVAVDSQASILFRNNRNGTFSDIGVPAGVAYSEDGREQAGMGSAARDFDGDGLPDLVKTNFIDDTANLYRNSGDETFEDRIHPSGMGVNMKYMGWGVEFLDYDNDGRPDIVMANGHIYVEIERIMIGSVYKQRRLLYRNLGGGKMADVSASSGAGIVALHSSRGLATGDFDNDGDVDVFINNMNERPSLLRNEGGNQNAFLSVRLVGRKSNRSAIGAQVTVTAGGVKQVQEVRSGSSFMSHSDLRLHFGLGAAKTIEKIEVRWPYKASVDVVTGLTANQFVTIEEGTGLRKP
ncbi:MAG: CRTAC1 family protein [Bryobacteraceae bacterium]